MKKICIIIGARPNFIKAFPVYEALKDHFDLTLIHTGQHFDEKMSKVFFTQLKFPKPDIHLTLTSKSRAGDYDQKLYMSGVVEDKNKIIEELQNCSSEKLGQLGEIRDKLIQQFINICPDMVLVFGDVTSTFASALAAKNLGIKLAHIESGLRSGDLLMPEEVNRILTDSISDLYFVTEQSGFDNLQNEGITENIYLVGNTMIDTQKKYLQMALETEYYKQIGCEEKGYILVTLHRPGNVDELDKLKNIMDNLMELGKEDQIVYPIHPRTKNSLEKLGILDDIEDSNIKLLDPLGYLEFCNLLYHAKYLITDSGGLQEESTTLDVPCFTLRPSTERPVTLLENGGTNMLISSLKDICYDKTRVYKNSIGLWDGQTSLIISNILRRFLYGNLYSLEVITCNDLNNIKIGDYHYKYKDNDFLYRNSGIKKKLLVSFHGAINRKIGVPVFRYYNYNFADYDVLAMSDTLLKLFNSCDPILELSWFLSPDGHNLRENQKEIISKIINLGGYDKVVFTGSSGGGHPSIYFASYFNQYCLIQNAQIYLDKHWYFKHMLNIVGLQNTDVDINIENAILEYGPPKKVVLYQNIHDNHHYQEHAKVFLEFLSKNGDQNVVSHFFERLEDGWNPHGLNTPAGKTIVDLLKENFI